MRKIPPQGGHGQMAKVPTVSQTASKFRHFKSLVALDEDHVGQALSDPNATNPYDTFGPDDTPYKQPAARLCLSNDNLQLVQTHRIF